MSDNKLNEKGMDDLFWHEYDQICDKYGRELRAIAMTAQHPDGYSVLVGKLYLAIKEKQKPPIATA